jgi:hypothetical protein
VADWPVFHGELKRLMPVQLLVLSCAELRALLSGIVQWGVVSSFLIRLVRLIFLGVFSYCSER